jgi:hypothetical protein
LNWSDGTSRGGRSAVPSAANDQWEILGKSRDLNFGRDQRKQPLRPWRSPPRVAGTSADAICSHQPHSAAALPQAPKRVIKHQADQISDTGAECTADDMQPPLAGATRSAFAAAQHLRVRPEQPSAPVRSGSPGSIRREESLDLQHGHETRDHRAEGEASLRRRKSTAGASGWKREFDEASVGDADSDGRWYGGQGKRRASSGGNSHSVGLAAGHRQHRGSHGGGASSGQHSHRSSSPTGSTSRSDRGDTAAAASAAAASGHRQYCLP